MSAETEDAVRAGFVRVMTELEGRPLDLDTDMMETYGLSSLDKILFLTSVCDSLQVSLATFTELDLAAMRTLREVTTAVARRRDAPTEVGS